MPANPVSPLSGHPPDPTGTSPPGSVDAVRTAVRTRHPVDGREVLSCARFLTELDRLGHPFDVDADPTHVTASAIVVGTRGVVLHKHRRLLRWMQPGGHVDPGETPEQAVLRECVEETGLPVAHPPDGPVLVHVDVHEAAKGHTHLDLRYLVYAPADDPAPPPGESQDVAWFTWDAAGDIADDALRGALVSARRVADHQGDVPWDDREDADG